MTDDWWYLLPVLVAISAVVAWLVLRWMNRRKL